MWTALRMIGSRRLAVLGHLLNLSFSLDGIVIVVYFLSSVHTLKMALLVAITSFLP